MKFKVKYKFVTIRGDVKTRTVTRESEVEFKDEVVDFEDSSGKIHRLIYRKENQMMEWLDDYDHWDWMVDNDIALILNYEIVKDKPKPKTLTLHNMKVKENTFLGYVAKEFNSVDVGEQVIVDFLATYAVMKKEVDRLPYPRRMSILIQAQKLGYSTSRNSLEGVLKYMQDLSKQKSVISTSHLEFLQALAKKLEE